MQEETGSSKSKSQSRAAQSATSPSHQVWGEIRGKRNMSGNPKRSWGWSVAGSRHLFSPRSAFRMWVLWVWHPCEPQASPIISCPERCCHLLCAHPAPSPSQVPCEDEGEGRWAEGPCDVASARTVWDTILPPPSPILSSSLLVPPPPLVSFGAVGGEFNSKAKFEISHPSLGRGPRNLPRPSPPPKKK